NVKAYYNEDINIQHIFNTTKRRKQYGNRNGSFEIFRWGNSVSSRTFKSIYVSLLISNHYHI
ncbi:hypothetical protein, partial [Bacillus toyonensis]|uniref:hypothetical protein n=1 Tax=Bacillus toyonensis TaxID=155322 RepID=UPI002FFECE88